jgi:hypothetical protein
MCCLPLASAGGLYGTVPGVHACDGITGHVLLARCVVLTGCVACVIVCNRMCNSICYRFSWWSPPHICRRPQREPGHMALGRQTVYGSFFLKLFLGL